MKHCSLENLHFTLQNASGYASAKSLFVKRLVLLVFLALTWIKTSDSLASGTIESANQTTHLHRTTKHIEINTRWLLNGLRVVAITGPWRKDFVSIRLIINGGFATSSSEDKYGFHFVEHLVFKEADNISDVYSTEGGLRGESYAYIELDHEIHGYDIESSQAESVLNGIVSEWDKNTFEKRDVEKERSRIVHEHGSNNYGSCLISVGHDLQPHGALSYTNEKELAFVDTVSAGTLRRIFDERYTAGNMTLAIAGNAGTVSMLDNAIDRFAGIPGGTGMLKPDLGDLSWLSGDVQTAAFRVGNHCMGFRFTDTENVPVRVQTGIRQAMVKRISEVLDESYCETHWVESRLEMCQTSEEIVWAFGDARPCFWIDDEPGSYQIIEESLEYLASPDAMVWWKEFLKNDNEEWRLHADRPEPVIRRVVGDLAGSAQDVAAPSWEEYVYKSDPLKYIDGARLLEENAIVFRIYRDKTRVDLSYSLMFDDSEISLSDFILLETGDDPVWSAVSLCTVFITFIATLLVVARIGIRATGKYASRIRILSAAVRKGQHGS